MISPDKLPQPLPPDELERLACAYALDKANSIKLFGAVVFLCLLNPDELSQRLLGETFHQHTGDTCDHSSFSQCFARIDPAYFDDLATFAAPQTRAAVVSRHRVGIASAVCGCNNRYTGQNDTNTTKRTGTQQL